MLVSIGVAFLFGAVFILAFMVGVQARKIKDLEYFMGHCTAALRDLAKNQAQIDDELEVIRYESISKH